MFENYSKLKYDQLKEDMYTTKKDVHYELKPERLLDGRCTHTKIDTHIHSKYSLDGYMEVEEIIKRAGENGTDYISITDHNNAMAFHNLMKSEHRSDKEILYNYDGVNVLLGSEITCHMFVDPTHRIKFHLLAYGFDRSEKSQTMELISTKYDDYKRSQYGVLYFLARRDPIYETSMSEFKSYMRDVINRREFSGTVDPNIAIDYYKWKGIGEGRIQADLKYYDKNLRRKDKLHIDIVDVINAVHQDGGLCALAHPTASIEKFKKRNELDIDMFDLSRVVTDRLLEVGLDGVEIVNVKGYNKSYANRYNEYYKDKAYLLSCGTDTHYIMNPAYKDIGKFYNDVSYANIPQIIEENERSKRLEIKNDRQKFNEEIAKTPQDTSINIDYTRRVENPGQVKLTSYYRRRDYDRTR